MATDMPGELLATLGRRRLGAIDVVRVTPSGRASRRESLFERGVVTRVWRTGVAPATTAVLGALVRRRLAS